MQSVKIVAVSNPTINQIHPFESPMSIDEFIAYVARVSNPSNQMNTATAPKLLKYLAKHKHWSPFEMVSICMEIETTRDIGRQILRHRSFSFQEFSQRYADPTKDMGFVTREARLQDTKNRQNSIETEDEKLQRSWELTQIDLRTKVEYAYRWAIEHGIAKEQARAVLPEGLTQSRMYMNGTLRSWIHYCELRMGVETQKEHREIATMAWEEIIKIFPSLSDVLSDTK
jgi:thymidylate synthase (FAD)